MKQNRQLEDRVARLADTRKFHAGFTLIELLVVVAILAIVLSMVPMSLGPQKRKARRIKCVSNLNNMGLAYRIYATDNGDRFPWQHLGTNGDIRVEYSADPKNFILAVSNELSTPKIVVCPEDPRKEATNWTGFSRENMSYFMSADASETYPQSFLAGDRNITNETGRLAPGLRRLSVHGMAGWDERMHKKQGNACMGDGSVQQLSGARLREQLRNTGLSASNITLSVP